MPASSAQGSRKRVRADADAGGARIARGRGARGARGSKAARTSPASEAPTGQCGGGARGGGREGRQRGQHVAQQQVASALLADFRPCGAGHARGARAVFQAGRGAEGSAYGAAGRAPVVCHVGGWIGDERCHFAGAANYSYMRKGLDLRHLGDREAPEGGCGAERRMGVPGWLGVACRTVRKVQRGAKQVGATCRREPWHERYNGAYAATLWDGARASYVAVNGFGTVEDAAAFFDRAALAAYGPEEANLNYPLADYEAHMAARGFGAEGALNSTSFVLLACRMLEHVQFLDSVDALDARASEVGEWLGVLRALCASPQTPSGLAKLARALLFVESKLAPAARMVSWAGALSKAWVEDAARLAATAEGGKAIPVMPVVKNYQEAVILAPHAARKRPWRLFGKATAATREHLTTLAALEKALVEDCISVSACLVLSNFGEPAARAMELEQAALRYSSDASMAAVLATKAAKGEEGRMRKAATELRKQADHARARAEAAQKASAAGATQLMRRCSRRALPQGLRVVVIGAGASGLYAATRLEREGAQVVVLEGRERLGGRMRTHTLRGGSKVSRVDLGASFICGTDTRPPLNPLFELAREEGLEMRAKHRSGGAWFDGAGNPIDRRLADRVETLGADLLQSLLAVSEKCGPERTIQDAVDAQLKKKKASKEQRDLLTSFFSDIYVKEMKELGLKEMTSEGYDGDHELVLEGYSRIAQLIHDSGADGKPLRDVRLGTRVTRVELVEGGGCRVMVDGGEVIGCHAVLCTLPLGVLQASADTQAGRESEAASRKAAAARGVAHHPPASVQFVPQLPPFKVQALEKLRMGTENRVAMLFNKPFWGDEHFLRLKHGAFSFFNNHALGLEGVLSAWVKPAHVACLEAMTDEQALAAALAELRKMYPAARGVEPEDYEVTRWASDPFSMGAYSCVPVGASRADYDRLAVPLTGDAGVDAKAGSALQGSATQPTQRVYFAGEATYKEDSYTVHGALLSGMREARGIAKWWLENAEEAIRWQL